MEAGGLLAIAEGTRTAAAHALLLAVSRRVIEAVVTSGAEPAQGHIRAETTMGYARLLAIGSGRDSDLPLLRAAANMAQRFDASVFVVPVFPDPDCGVLGTGFAMSSGGQTLIEQIIEEERAVMAAVAEAARSAAEQAQVPFAAEGCGARLVMQSRDRWPCYSMEDSLPLADLAMIGADSARGVGAPAAVFGELLLRRRLPVLVTRPETAPEFRRVCVAWDGSFSAGRAVLAALPVIVCAEEVFVLQVRRRLSEQQRRSSAADPEHLVEYLRCRGVQKFDVRCLEDEPEGPALTTAAAAVRADLLVAGAYGHARLREFVFGGATRAFLGASDQLSLFLAH